MNNEAFEDVLEFMGGNSKKPHKPTPEYEDSQEFNTEIDEFYISLDDEIDRFIDKEEFNEIKKGFSSDIQLVSLDEEFNKHWGENSSNELHKSAKSGSSIKVEEDKKERLSQLQLSKRVQNSNKFLILEDVLHMYNRKYGMYTTILNKNSTDTLIRSQAPEEIKEQLNSYNITEIVKWLNADAPDDWRVTELFLQEHAEKYVNFENCTLDITNMRRLPHSSDFYCMYALNMDYEEIHNYRNSLFAQVLDDMFADDQLKKNLLQEIFAIAIVGLQLKHFYFFKGVSNSGKTVLVNVLKEIIGTKYTSALPLESLGKNFKIANLAGTRLNVVSESSKLTEDTAEILKRLVGGDYISDALKYENEITFYNKATMIFTSNSNLKISGTADTALKNRFVGLEFTNAIPEERQDKNLLKKLKEPHELNAIVAWALEGLKRLGKNNFILTKTCNIDDFITQSPSPPNEKYDFVSDFKDFLNNTFDIDPANKKAFVPVATILEEFKKYLGLTTDFEERQLRIIHKVLQDDFLLIKKRPMVNGEQVYSYFGLKYKEESELF